MKLYHIIGLSTAGLLSLGALGVIAHKDSTSYNTDYRLETLTGDINVLNGMKLEGVTKVDQQSYSKVMISGEKIEVTPTKYDSLYHVGEEVLENRELYRNLFWPQQLETDKLLMTASFNSSYFYTNTEPVLSIRSKNKETGKTNIQEAFLENLKYGENIMSEFLTEHNGILYYIATAYGYDGNTNERILTYEIDPDSLSLKFKNEEDMTEWSSITIHDGFIYRLPYESNHLIVTNIETNETKTYKTTGLPEYASIYNIAKVDGETFFLIDSNLMEATFDDENQTVHLTPTQTPSFTSEFLSAENLMVNNNFIYTLYQDYKNSSISQYVSVLDPKTDKIVYEGKINIRSDQGLVSSYQLKKVSHD